MAKISGIVDPLQAAALRGAVDAEAAILRSKEQETGVTSTVRRRTLDALLNPSVVVPPAPTAAMPAPV